MVARLPSAKIERRTPGAEMEARTGYPNRSRPWTAALFGSLADAAEHVVVRQGRRCR